MSIRARVTLFGLAVLSGVLVLFCLAVYALLAGSAGKTRDQALADRARQAAAGLSVVDATGRPGPAPVDPRVSTDVFVVVLDAAGAPLAGDGAVDGRLPSVPRSVLDAAAARGEALATVDAAPGVELRVCVRTWSDGFVVAAQTTRRVAADRATALVLVVVYAILGFGVGAPAVWLVAGRALRPLRQFAGLADEIGRSADLARRLPPVHTRDDLGRLTSSFNAMLARLEEAYRRVADGLAAQRRFTADASHELRTPLTTIRSNAGFLLKHDDAAPDDRAAAVRDIAAESERMSRLVDNLLTLARADAGQPLASAPVDLGELAETVCRQVRGLHADRDIHCAVTPTPPVAGDADALAQLLWILLDNAVKFTSSGGTVWVAVTQRGNRAQVHVSDDGRGIPAGEAEHIFERFYRPEAGGPGAGLGLAIAAGIVARHGGTIVAANNARGGAAFVAEFPTLAP
jgi:signal transduction histidine kinase